MPEAIAAYRPLAVAVRNMARARWDALTVSLSRGLLNYFRLG